MTQQQEFDDTGIHIVTIGDLRRFLADFDGSDEWPVVIGGRDFDNAELMAQGLADELWTDSEGVFGGRLCLGAMTLGLAREPFME